MFTPGSKYFLGLSGLSFFVATLYMFLVNPNDLGALALLGLGCAFGAIGGFGLFTRDGDVFSEDDAIEASAASPTPSFWPIVFALGLALTLTGLATTPIVFVLGVATLIGGGVEWAIQNWADRASSDAAYNGFVRARAISAIEYPGIAAVGLVLIAFLFSRVMLTVSKNQGSVIFIIVASAILAAGFVIAFKPSLRGKATAIIATAGAVLLLVVGVASALSGERDDLVKAAKEDHFAAVNRECGTEKSKYYDKHPNNTVSLRSAVAATIFVEKGELYAQMIGLKTKLDTISIPRSNATSVLFRNLDDTEYRLVVNLGSVEVAETGVKEKVGTCTQLTGKNQEQVMTLKIAKPAMADEPYTFTVPGVTGQIKLVVP
jgi:hypothetical protein